MESKLFVLLVLAALFCIIGFADAQVNCTIYPMPSSCNGMQGCVWNDISSTCTNCSCDVTTLCDSECSCDLDCGETACTDGADNDQDGEIDCYDDDCLEDSACLGCIDFDADTYYNETVANCYGANDCNDGALWVNPGATEGCGNGIDDDCDGLIDCADSNCTGMPVCQFLKVTYGPANPTTDQPLVLYARDNSTDEIVADSYIDYKEPGSESWTAALTNGTHTITGPLAGTYQVYATKTGWTNSETVNITVTTPTTTTMPTTSTTLTSSTSTSTSTSTSSTTSTSTTVAGTSTTSTTSTSTTSTSTTSTSTTSTTSTSTTTIFEGHNISLKSRTFVPDEGIDSAINISEMSATDYVMIQFREIPGSEERDNLSQYGITLLDYLPEYSFFASAAMEQLAEAVALSNLRSIVKILPGDKIAPNSTGSLLVNLTESDGLVNVRAVFFSDVSSYEALAILENHSQNISGPGMLNDWVIRGDNDTINSLANNSKVRWIEISSQEDEDANDGARATIGANRVQSFYNLRGRNVTVGIWESGNPDNTHPDLEGRINVIENKMIKDHATHVAGTVGGTGKNSSGRLRGMAPNVTFCAYSTAGDDNEAEDHEDAIKNKGINLSQNSWRSGNYTLRGRYTARSKKFDQVVRGVYDRKIPVIFISGNENTQTATGYNTVMPPGGTAKNTITVGAVNSDDYGMPWFSSWGPTNDGRLKPDIVAPGCQAGGDGGINSSTPDAFINVYPWADWDGSGDDFRPFYDVMCGTSMAAPVVSGAVSLMMEYFKDMGNNRHGTLPLPSTYKALLIHTAHDVNETGPDYPTGYGLINVSKATYFLRRGGINAMIEEGTITMAGNTDSYRMYVSNYTEEFKVTLAWDDWEGTENAYKELVNDLDLVVIAPNGTIYRPWSLNRYTPSASATTGIDRKNNVEQVYVNDPCDGNWTINVTGHIIANPNNPQNYSLVHNNFFPEILMGDAPEDDGGLPSGENFWDGEVWIDSNLNGIEDIAPVPGQINHLHATVQEFGGDIARDVSVNFYYASPSTAITYPDDWEFIGNTTISSIAAYGSADAYVSWIPPATPEHQCTIVTISNAENPITYEGDVRDDKNIGMKNFWTISIDETYSFEFEVGNNKGSSGDARLEMNSSSATDGWQVYLSPEEFYSLSPGQTQTATLMVTPPEGTVGEASIGAGTAGQNATIHITEYLTTDSGEEITGGVSVTFVIASNETTITTSTTSTSTTSTSSTSSTTSSSTSTTVVGECTLVGDEPPCNEIELAEVIDLINLWAADGAELSEVIDLINAWASN